MSLSALQVKQAAPRDRPYKMGDSGGLYLLVKPNGAKYWRMKYRFLGKEKTLSIGTAKTVSLSEARAARDKARAHLLDGIDPMAERKQRKAEAQAREGNDFKSVAIEWHGQNLERWSADHAGRILRSLENDVFPALGSRPVSDITAQEILAAVKVVEDRGALEYSHRVLQRIGQVFRYAVVIGRVPHNPAADLRGALKVRKAVNHAALSREQLPAFLRSLEEYDGHRTTKLGLEMIARTFLRTTELREALWSEIDMERAEWRVPADRMKMRHEHLVPLSTQALAVLESLQEINGRYRYVFTGRNSVARPISENTLLYALYRMGYKRQATVHGFRATASTILNESGFNRDAIERQLAHIEGNKVRAAYHRSEYLDERRTMMQWWSDYLDSIGRGATVVPIRGAS